MKTMIENHRPLSDIGSANRARPVNYGIVTPICLMRYNTLAVHSFAPTDVQVIRGRIYLSVMSQPAGPALCGWFTVDHPLSEAMEAFLFKAHRRTDLSDK